MVETTAVPERRAAGPVVVLVLLAVAVLAVHVSGVRIGVLHHPAVQAWATVFVAIVVQALPFLVLGVLVSAVIATFVPPSFFADALPRKAVAAVPVASVAGAVLPGCECASVPVAQRLVARGITPAAAFAFMLSAPAVNPVVLVATAVAFPGRPEMVVGRIVASLIVATLTGYLWTLAGRPEWIASRRRPEPAGGTRFERFAAEMRHDFLQAGGMLVVGAMAAATLNVVVPPSVVGLFAGHPLGGVLALGVLAVVLAVCSEADAFVASSLTQFSPTAQLAFLVVGPMVDVKLIAMQAGAFGRAFVLRFAPVVFGLGIVVSVLVGALVL